MNMSACHGHRSTTSTHNTQMVAVVTRGKWGSRCSMSVQHLLLCAVSYMAVGKPDHHDEAVQQPGSEHVWCQAPDHGGALQQPMDSHPAATQLAWYQQWHMPTSRLLLLLFCLAACCCYCCRWVKRACCAGAGACTINCHTHQVLPLQALVQLLLGDQPLQHCCLCNTRHRCMSQHAQRPQLHDWQQHGMPCTSACLQVQRHTRRGQLVHC